MPSDKKLLLGLTTSPGSNWREKVSEIDQLNLQEVALFPTMLATPERQVLYKMLESTHLETIPYVHLRDDFKTEEVDYLVERFKVKAMSCHADAAGLALLDKLPKYNSLIYVENAATEDADKLFSLESFNKHQVSGVCLDLAHLEEARLSSKRHYKKLLTVLQKQPIKINHISGIKNSIFFKIFNKTSVDHSLNSLNDLLYLKQIPPIYWAGIIALELENSLLEQTEIKKFLETLIN